jgi:tRNA(Ile)-lysidine synthase
MSNETMAALDRIKEVARAPPLQVSLTGGLEPLRAVAQSLSVRVDEIDRQGSNLLFSSRSPRTILTHLVDHHLKMGHIPSFPGTFLLSTSELGTIHDETVRSAMILRILRYVSSQPWGSLQADGGRKRHSIRQIVEKVWNPDPWKAGLKQFTAGGGVLWCPVTVGNAGRIKFRKGCYPNIPRETTAWLASRLPPKTDTQPAASDPLHLDVTDLLAEKLAWSKENEGKVDVMQALLKGQVQVLWDCRFLLHFLPSYMPKEIEASISGPSRGGKIVIAPFSRWYLPTVTWTTTGLGTEEDVPLISVEAHESKEPALDCDSPCPMQSSGHSREWIHIGWARSLKVV